MHHQTLPGPDPNEVNSGRCGSKTPTALCRCHHIGGGLLTMLFIELWFLEKG